LNQRSSPSPFREQDIGAVFADRSLLSATRGSRGPPWLPGARPRLGTTPLRQTGVFIPITSFCPAPGLRKPDGPSGTLWRSNPRALDRSDRTRYEGREFFAALLVPAFSSPGALLSGIQNSKTARRTDQFLRRTIDHGEQVFLFDSFVQICPQTASLACRGAQSRRHNQVWAIAKQQCDDATTRLAPYGMRQSPRLPALCVDPLRRLGSQAIDLLCFLGPHSLPPRGSGIVSHVLRAMDLFPSPFLLLLVLTGAYTVQPRFGGVIDCAPSLQSRHPQVPHSALVHNAHPTGSSMGGSLSLSVPAFVNSTPAITPLAVLVANQFSPTRPSGKEATMFVDSPSHFWPPWERKSDTCGS